MATLSKKRRFVGVEIESESYQTSMNRIQEWEKKNRMTDPVKVNQPDNVITLVENEESSLAA